MKRQEFGSLVATLRKEQRNDFDEVMTQYDLAEQARMPLVTLQKIEQGRQANLKPEMLLNLALALKLSSRSREAFLLCASGLPESEIVASSMPVENALAELRDSLARLQTPGFITDCFGDILFLNPALLVVYDNSPEGMLAPHLLTQFNIIRILMAPEFDQQRQMMGESAPTFMRRTVLLYKTMSIKYRTHWYFQMILPELNRYPLFREHWQSPVFHDEDVFINYNTIQLKHPKLGALSFLSGPLQGITSVGDLNLYSFQPLDAQTVAVCAEVVQQVGNAPIPLAHWPKKKS
ncbi:MAG: helix-turn-helix transcriptional regulator [Anaerolineales bacterium]|jgi:transcriptional regulator with XRE-family HTH domain|nr:helix-turn-helix transcriptional regulator [Anaerolineales bacterium]